MILSPLGSRGGGICFFMEDTADKMASWQNLVSISQDVYKSLIIYSFH
jgi:hypothetical protein